MALPPDGSVSYTPRKVPLIPTGYEAGWAPGPVRKLLPLPGTKPPLLAFLFIAVPVGVAI
jgi:hypothetical protein